jgi:glycerol uptake facilitator-like aquaporin
MAERLSGGNVGLALLANSLATGAMLFVLITVLAPVSGAHMNPAVSLVFALRREIGPLPLAAYVGAQIAGGLAGTALAQAMFASPLVEVSHHTRAGAGLWLGEGVATFGLVGTILGARRAGPAFVAPCVALFITAAYWFTSSTSFANPAVTIARSLTDSFAGIAPRDAAAFIAAQLIGATLAALATRAIATASVSP